MKRKWLAWALVLGWMGLIFYLSGQNAVESGDTSGKIVEALLGIFYPKFSQLSLPEQEKILGLISLVVRKGAHFTEYAILAMLLANALRGWRRPGIRWWVVSYGAATLYAMTDEIHQAFVPGRACQLMDVAIDSTGAAVGTAVFALGLWLAARHRKKR